MTKKQFMEVDEYIDFFSVSYTAVACMQVFIIGMVAGF